MSTIPVSRIFAVVNGRTIVRRRKKGFEARFWAKVDRRGDDECWLWIGGLTATGYGQTSADPGPDEYVGRKLSAHRAAYQIAFGPIPDGLHVLHNCDNRACVNPAHLFLGTHQDNMADMVAKARHARGERQPTRKLDSHRVRSIRWLAEHDPATQRELAAEFGVTRGAIGNILSGNSWRAEP